ncbi:GNAT family N-acetyltransferase [Tropicimonas sp.]|uniref:GNAT family N-acetyltransferase n=1 Tax=Tropicimonas sp. TaxID=2067044 RepID=UPI003A83B7D1
MARGRDDTTIITPRLILRPLRQSDGPAIVAGVGSLDVAKWLAVVPHPYGPGDAAEFLAFANGRRDHWAITREGILIGVISTDGEIGYWLTPEVWGHGYATEAAGAVADRWFAAPDAGDLPARHKVGNRASARCLQGLGFVYTGHGMHRSRALGRDMPGLAMRLTRSAWEGRLRLPFLVTARTRTRPLTATDAKRLSAIVGTPDVAPMTSSISCPWSEDAAAEWIEDRRWKGQPGFCIGLCERVGGALIGLIGLSPAGEDETASVMYALDKSRWGAGLASEAAAALLRAVFRDFPLAAVTAGHFTDNPASGRVLRKLGFAHVEDGMGQSLARLEPAPVSHYRLNRSTFEART